jgi:hypothetical protein
MSMTTKYKWKFRELIAALGGAAELTRKIEDYGFDPPPYQTVKGWQTRSSIPPHHVLIVLMIAQDEGVLPKLSALLRK